MDTSTDRAALAEAIRSSLAAAVPNSNGVIWEHQHEDGQREPVTIDALTGMVMQHVENARSPRPAAEAVDIGERVANKAAEVAAASVQPYGVVMDALMAAAGYVPAARPTTEPVLDGPSFGDYWDTARPATVSDEQVEAAWWREMEAGRLTRDRGGYTRQGFEVGYKAAALPQLATQPADVDHLAALIEAHPRYERLDGVVFCQHAGGYQHWGPGYDGYARHLAEVLADSVQPADVSDEQVNAGAEALTAYHGEPNYPGEHHADARRVLTAAQPADVDRRVREAAAKAWDEGYGAAEVDAAGHRRGDARNPYRSVRDEGGDDYPLTCDGCGRNLPFRHCGEGGERPACPGCGGRDFDEVDGCAACGQTGVIQGGEQS